MYHYQLVLTDVNHKVGMESSIVIWKYWSASVGTLVLTLVRTRVPYDLLPSVRTVFLL